jgi:hypothetical protein
MLACNCNITPTRNFFSRYNIDFIAPAKYPVVELVHSYSVLSRQAFSDRDWFRKRKESMELAQFRGVLALLSLLSLLRRKTSKGRHRILQLSEGFAEGNRANRANTGK